MSQEAAADLVAGTNQGAEETGSRDKYDGHDKCWHEEARARHHLMEYVMLRPAVTSIGTI